MGNVSTKVAGSHNKRVFKRDTHVRGV
jgi:hypothetical protein